MNITKVVESLSEMGGYDVYINGVPFHYYEDMPKTQRVQDIAKNLPIFLESNDIITAQHVKEESKRLQEEFTARSEELTKSKEADAERFNRTMAKAIASGDEEAIFQILQSR